MIMVGHQAVGMDDPVESLPHACEHIEKQLPVTDVSNNVLPSVPSRSDVIECTGKLESQGPGHDSKIARKGHKSRPDPDDPDPDDPSAPRLSGAGYL
jgi:hypothetical protein